VLRSRAGKKIEEGKTRAADPLSAGRARPGRVAAEETWICVGNLAGELWIESGPCELNEIQDEEFATATKRKLVGVKNEELELRFRSYSTKAKEGKWTAHMKYKNKFIHWIPNKIDNQNTEFTVLPSSFNYWKQVLNLHSLSLI
jgi:hypothetical protein